MAYVSDHAVLRYIERVMHIDVEAVRAEIASSPIDVAAEQGCDTILRHDCRLKLQGDIVATVLPRKHGRNPHYLGGRKKHAAR